MRTLLRLAPATTMSILSWLGALRVKGRPGILIFFRSYCVFSGSISELIGAALDELTDQI